MPVAKMPEKGLLGAKKLGRHTQRCVAQGKDKRLAVADGFADFGNAYIALAYA